jgi:hypothetical protein
MNLPQAIESAFYDLIRKQSLGCTPLIRCWHNMRKDTRWNETTDRELPCITINCSPFVPDETNSATGTARIAIRCKSNGEKDKAHAIIGAMEEGVDNALTGIRRDLYNGATSTDWLEFEATIKECSSVLSVGGIMLEQGDEPGLDDDDPIVGFVGVLAITKNV